MYKRQVFFDTIATFIQNIAGLTILAGKNVAQVSNGISDVYKRQGLTRAGTGTPDIANLMAIADLFQISVDELLSNEKSEKKQSNYCLLYTSPKKSSV